MRTNSSGVTEVAHVRSYGSDSYAENYERIFGKKEKCEDYGKDKEEAQSPSCYACGDAMYGEEEKDEE